MKSIKTLASAILTAGILSVTAFAADSATQTVTYQVSAINELSVSSDTVSLTVNAAVAGSAPTSVSNSATSYAITTNETGRKITAKINTAMSLDDSLTLSINLAAPTGGTALGPKVLTTTEQDLVSGISTLNESGKTITYTLAATSAAGVVTSASKTVTLTIIAGGV